jgi:hypothetical protein
LLGEAGRLEGDEVATLGEGFEHVAKSTGHNTL